MILRAIEVLVILLALAMFITALSPIRRQSRDEQMRMSEAWRDREERRVRDGGER